MAFWSLCSLPPSSPLSCCVSLSLSLSHWVSSIIMHLCDLKFGVFFFVVVVVEVIKLPTGLWNETNRQMTRRQRENKRNENENRKWKNENKRDQKPNQTRKMKRKMQPKSMHIVIFGLSNIFKYTSRGTVWVSSSCIVRYFPFDLLEKKKKSQSKLFENCVHTLHICMHNEYCFEISMRKE